MPLPKRKSSIRRRNNRRAHLKLIPPNFVRCTQCQGYRMPHQACPTCGYYGGRAAIAVKKSKPKGK